MLEKVNTGVSVGSSVSRSTTSGNGFVKTGRNVSVESVSLDSGSTGSVSSSSGVNRSVGTSSSYGSTGSVSGSSAYVKGGLGRSIGISSSGTGSAVNVNRSGVNREISSINTGGGVSSGVSRSRRNVVAGTTENSGVPVGVATLGSTSPESVSIGEPVIYDSKGNYYAYDNYGRLMYTYDGGNTFVAVSQDKFDESFKAMEEEFKNAEVFWANEDKTLCFAHDSEGRTLYADVNGNITYLPDDNPNSWKNYQKYLAEKATEEQAAIAQSPQNPITLDYNDISSKGQLVFYDNEGNYLTCDNAGNTYFIDRTAGTQTLLSEDSPYHFKNFLSTDEAAKTGHLALIDEKGNFYTCDKEGNTYYIDRSTGTQTALPADSEYSFNNLLANKDVSASAPTSTASAPASTGTSVGTDIPTATPTSAPTGIEPTSTPTPTSVPESTGMTPTSAPASTGTSVGTDTPTSAPRTSNDVFLGEALATDANGNSMYKDNNGNFVMVDKEGNVKFLNTMGNENNLSQQRPANTPSEAQIAKYTEQARQKAMQDAMREAEIEAARNRNKPSEEQIAAYSNQARERAIENARKIYGNNIEF